MKKTIAEMEQTAASEAANKLISLFDEDSFVELGKFVGANGEKTGVVSGCSSYSKEHSSSGRFLH